MPETSPAMPYGLRTDHDVAVPLVGVSIAADVRSLCARVTVTQRYVNREPVPVEAVYLFPLDEGAAVCGFEALIDGTLVVGEVKEREEAFRMYDDAMAEGHGAYLLDEERADVFQASVGNLPPGKEAILKVTYVTELGTEGGDLRFVIPTTVSPRYAPAADTVGVGRPDASTLNPPRAFDVPYGLDLSVRVAMPGTIGRVSSPSHPIDVRIEASGVTVTLAQQQAALDRDFVLALEGTGLEHPRAWIERTDEGEHAVAIGFLPALPDVTTPSEVVFVVDRSGSMEGSSIEEVRNALQLCLRSLAPGCFFNIVGFGDTWTALFERSRAYDEANLRAATGHVAVLEADLGGTEILPALEAVLKAPGVEGLARQVVVLTDGQVSNTDSVLELVKAQSAGARVFAIGIGAGASRHLVQGLARAGGGTTEFIAPGERIEARVVRLVGRLLSPALTNVRLDWGGLKVRPASSVVPPLFAGSRLVQYAFVDEMQPATVRLKATSAAGPVSFDVPVDPAQVVPGAVVATLAARARIRELEESPAWLGTRGSRQRRPRPTSAVSELVALALRYSLVSRETSFVAIERREQPVLGDVQLRCVPIALTHAWGGVHQHRLAPQARHAIRMVPASLQDTGAWYSAPREAPSTPRTLLTRLSALLRSDVPDEQAETAQMPECDAFQAGVQHSDRLHEPTIDPRRAGVLALASLQQAHGPWTLDEALSRAIGRSLDDVRRRLAELTSGLSGDARAEAEAPWATALALAWLEREAAALADEWQFLARKADGWLRAQQVASLDGHDWREAARQFLAQTA
jgi:hypothetical protein